VTAAAPNDRVASKGRFGLASTTAYRVEAVADWRDPFWREMRCSRHHWDRHVTSRRGVDVAAFRQAFETACALHERRLLSETTGAANSTSLSRS
jgi:hypothetical protein